MNKPKKNNNNNTETRVNELGQNDQCSLITNKNKDNPYNVEELDGCATYDAKVNVVNENTIRVYCPTIKLDFTMTKSLFIKYLLGDAWYITPARTPFETLFLEKFETGQLDLDLKIHFKFEASKASSIRSLTIKFSCNVQALRDIILNLEDTEIKNVLNVRVSLLEKIREDIRAQDSIKKKLPLLFMDLKNKTKENDQLKKYIEEECARTRRPWYDPIVSFFKKIGEKVRSLWASEVPKY